MGAVARVSPDVWSRAKVRVPSQHLMDRPRLIDRLERHPDASLVLLQASAGYGKSSLLQQWATHLARSGANVAWLSLDAADREPVPFLRRLLRALEEAGSPIDASLAADLQREGDYSALLVVTAIANSFVDRRQPFHLFFDDAHFLRGSEALGCLRTLLEAAPVELRLCVGTREDLGIPLGRLRALGQMVELRTEDLCFDLAETASYLALHGHNDLSDAEQVLVHERTEGWAVGLKLCSMALHGNPEHAQVLETFTGERRQIADFFAEDVFSRQAPELQDFMLRSSTLDWLSPALCDSVLQIDRSREMIDRCEAAGLFLVARDDTRTAYRYQHLFAEHLRRQLRDRMPGVAKELHRRASEWLLFNGFQIEAFDYALRAQDPMRAAEILDSHCEAMWAAGQQETIQRLAARIPPHIQALFPRIMLLISWRLIAQWQIGEARNLLTVSRARLAEMERAEDGGALVAKLKRLALHRESQIAHASYDLTRLEELCGGLIQEASELDPYLLASCYNSLQYAQREQYKLGKVERFEALAYAELAKTGNTHGRVFASAISGPSYLMLGKTQTAIDVMTAGLGLAEERAGVGAGLGALVAMPLSQAHYERNDIDTASQLIERYLPVAPVVGFVDQLVSGWLTKSRLLRLRGDWSGAGAVLEEAVEFGAKHDLDRLRIVATAEHVRLLLRTGRPEDAVRLARRRGIQAQPPSGGARHTRFTAQDGAVALAWCRLAAARDQVNDALTVARQWRSFVVAAQAIHAAVEWDILVAELLQLTGERLAAKRSIAQAVARAAPGRFVRAFLDEGEPVVLQLQQLTQDRRLTDDPSDLFLRTLLNQAETEGLGVRAEADGDDDDDEESGALVGRMNSREIEILALASTGLLNRQIGDKLGLTEGTVKWYLQQVFDKVGIRDRVKAAEKVRRLGLMQ